MSAPTSNLDRYLAAATRDNTRRSYAGAVRHFEVEAGRLLPATAEQLALYLADYGATLSVATLEHRLAALGAWHRDHGFVDPSRAPLVRRTLKGIRTVHGSKPKQATPLVLTQLGQVADALEAGIAAAQAAGDTVRERRHCRDRALVLLGFWRGFRGDEMLHLQVADLEIEPGRGMHCYVGRSKGDRALAGRRYPVPALSRWCPVTAVSDWLTVAALTEGAVFRGIDQWGQVRADGMHPNSFIPLLRRIFADVGLAGADGFSGHSLRRGFASWANSQGWDLKSLMQYVGWRDVTSAMRYLEVDPFARERIEASLPPLPAPSPVLPAPPAK